MMDKDDVQQCSSSAANEPKTYFSHKDRMFPELVNGKIPTDQFLLACQGLADFVGILGTAFLPVKSDIAGNVKTIRTKYETDMAQMHFLQDLVDIDVSESNGKLGRATISLLWLKRGLEFMVEFLKHMVQAYRKSQPDDLNKTESLVSILQCAYEQTLMVHHNWISKQLFKICIRAAPYRKTLLKELAYGHSNMDEACIQHIEQLLGNFEENVRKLVECYRQNKLETPERG